MGQIINDAGTYCKMESIPRVGGVGVDLHSLAFDFVSSFGFVFVSEAADDDDGFAREGSERRFSAFGGACGSPVAALNVERSDWKLMVTVDLIRME